jgi:hypothetical protein
VAVKTPNLVSGVDCPATTGIPGILKFCPFKELTTPEGGVASPFDGRGGQRECFKNNSLREIC